MRTQEPDLTLRLNKYSAKKIIENFPDSMEFEEDGECTHCDGSGNDGTSSGCQACGSKLYLISKEYNDPEPCCAECGATYCQCHQEANVYIPLSKPDISHYVSQGIEPIDIIDVNDLDFLRGNLVKYASRLDRKGDPRGDADKMVQYAQWTKEKEYRGD